MHALLRITFIIVLCLTSSNRVRAQQSRAATEDIWTLARELQQTRSDLAESQRQIQQLRQDVQKLEQQLQARQPANQGDPDPAPTVAAADQDVGFLAGKLSELHQDKVESASKYPVKLSGLILFNSYINGGSVAAQDLPVLAFRRTPGGINGSIGATLSQTLLGVEVKGPKLLGGQSTGTASIDFSGGYPTTPYGITAGLIRLRSASVRLDWSKTALQLGQDTPFFSPLSPTSYASVAEPAFSWAGNLWVWTPQIEVERRITLTSDSSLVLQSGLLDPLTEEPPPFQIRTASAGEATRMPGVAARVAWSRGLNARLPFVIGVGGYHAHQRYKNFPEIDSWTVNSDFDFRPTGFLELSGEWYQGQAVGGLGGGIWTSVVYPDATEPHSALHPLRSTGGWTQIKVKPSLRWEVNTALGQDENYARDLRFFPVSFTAYGSTPFQKNRASFINAIYKPKTSLLFAIEYRRLFTAPAGGESASGGQLNLAAGVQF